MAMSLLNKCRSKACNLSGRSMVLCMHCSIIGDVFLVLPIDMTIGTTC